MSEESGAKKRKPDSGLTGSLITQYMRLREAYKSGQLTDEEWDWAERQFEEAEDFPSGADAYWQVLNERFRILGVLEEALDKTGPLN